KKKKQHRKGSNNDNSVRSQSPDSPPLPRATADPGGRSGLPALNKLNSIWPRRGSPAASKPSVRAQSPDNGYGGYGGQAVNPLTPGGLPYTANQAPAQSTQPPIVGAPPANSIYAPAYGAPPANGAPPAYGQAPGYGPPPGYGQPPGGYGAPGQPGFVPGAAPPNGGLLPSPQPTGSNLLDDRPVIPFDVYVSEGQTGRFMFGAGVNSNAGLIGSIVLDEQNFDIWRLPGSFEDFRSGQAFRGGGQKFRIEAAPGTQVSRYMINFTEPYLFDLPVSYGLSGYYFQRFYRDWTEQRAGGRTTLGYQFTPDLSGTVALRAEDIRISQPRILGVPDLDAVLGYTQLYSIKTQLAHDTRDSTFLPTSGHYVSADFEYAVGTFIYPRWTIDAREHFLLRERPDGSGRHTLSFYNTFGITGSNTPIYERFFAGGFSTLRGFQFRGASPQVDTVEVGGDFENLSSIEYMFPITADDMLRMVTFVDFGTVEPTVHINWRDTRVAPGIGLRIQVPAMGPAPIALDLAFPVQYAPNDIRQIFSFFVGYSR
ncbi:MAG TPA: BamA/TamA family outer membrane protein, partial [Pirellulales bacterium]|nr:BamA/TamA family outer membrane protein [Pirellulales bacterium]